LSLGPDRHIPVERQGRLVLGVRTSLRSHHRIRNHTRHLQTLNHPHQSPGQPQPTSRPRPLNDETMDERVPSPIPQSHQIPTDIEPHPPIAGQDPPPDPQSQPTSRPLNDETIDEQVPPPIAQLHQIPNTGGLLLATGSTPTSPSSDSQSGPERLSQIS